MLRQPEFGHCSIIEVIDMSMQKNDVKNECRLVSNHITGLALGIEDATDLSSIQDHLRQCPGCLKRFIAIQAAAELASVSFCGSASPS